MSYAAPQMAALGRTQIEARLLAFARRHREAAIGHQLPLYSAAMAASDHGHTFDPLVPNEVRYQTTLSAFRGHDCRAKCEEFLRERPLRSTNNRPLRMGRGMGLRRTAPEKQ